MEQLPSKEDLHILSTELENALSSFRSDMHEKLWKKRAKGDLWKTYTVDNLLKLLKEELSELDEAFASGQPRQIMDECVDVANFAMLIYARKQREWTDDLNSLNKRK